MDYGLVLTIIAAGLVCSVLSEIPAWLFCYRRESYKELISLVDRKKAQLEAEREKAKENATKATVTKIKALEEIVQVKSQEAAQAGMKGQLISSGVMMIMFPLVMRNLRDIVVGQLPFTPFWPLTMITQQGLSAPESPADFSGVCLFFVAMTVMRNFIKQLNPVPQGPSLLEVARKAQSQAQPQTAE